MQFLKDLFAKKPGLLRTVVAVYVFAVVALKALHLDSIADALGSVAAWIGITPASTGFPVDQAALSAAVLALVALVRVIVRWYLNKPSAPTA